MYRYRDYYEQDAKKLGCLVIVGALAMIVTVCVVMWQLLDYLSAAL